MTRRRFIEPQTAPRARLAFISALPSPMSATCFHSPSPFTCTLVSELTRPSASHWRIYSALTGPYSCESAPIILHIGIPSTNFADELQFDRF